MPGEFGEKTEAPTPKRRQEARQRGQVAKSQDLTAAVVLLAGLVTLKAAGPWMWKKLLSAMRGCLSADQPVSVGDLVPTAGALTDVMIWLLVPLLVVVFIAAAGMLLWQVGFLITWQPLTPNLDKLSPLKGFKRIFSPRTAMTTVFHVGKMFLLAFVVYWTLAGAVGKIMFSMDMGHIELYVMAAQLVFDVGIRMVIVMLVLALFDYLYQRYRHEQELKMSKEEIREEMKRMEGDPTLKRRRREVQMKLALQRIRQAVPTADVVVTNPTHYAIALKYDPEAMAAPKVVAKGSDQMAYRIRQIAAAAHVPIVERRELVRMMYDAVEIGQEIPERFYEAIAEVLAYVYELSGKDFRPRPVPIG